LPPLHSLHLSNIMTTKIRRRRRCVLSVPGKPEARHNVVHAFNEGDWGNTVRCFRMNGLDTEYAYNDLITVVEGAGQNIDTLMIPKVKYARDVEWVDTFLSQIERKMGFENKIGLELLIEEVEGIANINAISLASDRVEALHFGIGDYVRAQGVDIRDTATNAAWLRRWAVLANGPFIPLKFLWRWQSLAPQKRKSKWQSYISPR